MKVIKLIEHLPEHIMVGESEKKMPIKIIEHPSTFVISYKVPIHNHKGHVGFKEHKLSIPKEIPATFENFQVFGLLQAEMGKTNNGCLTYANKEHQLINPIFKFFKREFDVLPSGWKWYLRFKNYSSKEQEEKAISWWIEKSPVTLSHSYPKIITISTQKSKKELAFCDHGALTIDLKHNFFSQIIKQLIRNITATITTYESELIRAYMRGIIAGEGCININKENRTFRVIVSALDPSEKRIFQDCFTKLELNSIEHKYEKLIISKKQNLFKLLDQKLMCLSPKKYNKFLQIKDFYASFDELADWKEKQKVPHNKISEEIIKKIIDIKKSNPNFSSAKVAESVGVSKIKVCRVWKENNLGKRVEKLSEEKRKEIVDYFNEHHNLTTYQVAKEFKVSQSAVIRACKKYEFCTKRKRRICTTKQDKIIELLELVPHITNNQISDQTGVSTTAIQNLRNEVLEAVDYF